MADITVDVGSLHLFAGSNIESKDIVDGHREKTLGLLWKIMFAFHVRFLSPHLQFERFNIFFLFLSLVWVVDCQLICYSCAMLPRLK